MRGPSPHDREIEDAMRDHRDLLRLLAKPERDRYVRPLTDAFGFVLDGRPVVVSPTQLLDAIDHMREILRT